jgi:hypothetical protein
MVALLDDFGFSICDFGFNAHPKPQIENPKPLAGVVANS